MYGFMNKEAHGTNGNPYGTQIALTENSQETCMEFIWTAHDSSIRPFSRVAFCVCFKTRPGANMSFMFLKMNSKADFQMKQLDSFRKEAKDHSIIVSVSLFSF